MQISIADNAIIITCSGVQLLRLKAQLASRVQGKISSDKYGLRLPLSALPFVEDLLPEIPSEIVPLQMAYRQHSAARAQALQIVETNSSEGIPENWMQCLEPAQATAVAAMTCDGLLGMCLFDEQGSGKTVMTIAAFDILKARGFIDAMIVLCPKSMLGEWPKDIEHFLPSKYSIVTADGTRQERFNAAMENFDILITNYEGLKHIKTVLNATALKKNYLLVADESYNLKTPDAVRSETAMETRKHCKKCFVLCGTPAPNTAHDLINQFDLADLGYTFGGFKKSKDPVADREPISDLVERRGAFIRRLKSDILASVPEKNFHILRVQLFGRQAALYEKSRSELELSLRALDNTLFKKNLTSYFQKRSALMQICTQPSSIDPTLTETPAKYLALDTLVDDLINTGHKVILWSFYRDSLDALAARYARYIPLRIDGTVPAEERATAVTLFQNDPSRMLFIGNPSAAGAGITLHAAAHAIYLSYSNQAAHYLQSLDRIHRRGQKASEVNYYLLICEGTIEETEVKRLRDKEIQQHKLLGDHIVWPASIDEALAELQISQQGRQ